MRKRDGTKRSRFERPSLFPASSAGTSDETHHDSTQPHAAPVRTSWTPPTGGIVRARLLPEAGWEDYGTSNVQVSIPPTQGFGTSTRESMIPKAPPLPRMSVAPADTRSRPSLTPPDPRARLSLAPAEPQKSRLSVAPPRMSMGPSAPRATNKFDDPWERMNLTPAIGFASIAPPGRFDEPASEEHRRYTQALFLREQGRTEEAVAILDDVCRLAPEHHEARALALKLALENKDADRIEAHAEWVIQHQAKANQPLTVCSLYKSARMALPTMVWSERALLAVLLAADRVSEGRVVVDVTKMLLHSYPESPALPRALYASAAVQHCEGRPDLARTTLESLVARFPRASLTPMARKRLLELG